MAAAALAAAGIGDAAATTRKRSVGNSCKLNSDCASGLCVQEGPTRRICQHCGSAGDCPPPSTQCHAATCSPSGNCGQTITAGPSCNDGNVCTTGDVCQADGSCVGTAVTCQPLDECHDAGTCDPSTGVCSNPAKTDGTACTGGICCNGTCTDDTTTSNCGSCGNLCPAGDTCSSGTCVAPPTGAGTCVAGTDYCSTGTFTTCSHSPTGTRSGSCGCFVKTNGDMFCGGGGNGCLACNIDADCSGFGAGWACIVIGGVCSDCSESATPFHLCAGPCPS